MQAKSKEQQNMHPSL